MRQHSGAPAPKWNRQITRRIFPPDSEKSSGNETKLATHLERSLCINSWHQKNMQGHNQKFIDNCASTNHCYTKLNDTTLIFTQEPHWAAEELGGGVPAWSASALLHAEYWPAGRAARRLSLKVVTYMAHISQRLCAVAIFPAACSYSKVSCTESVLWKLSK